MTLLGVGLAVASSLPAGGSPALGPTIPAPSAFVGEGVVRGDIGPARGSAFRAARSALAAHAPALGAGSFDFRFETIRRSIVGTHVRGRQVVGGVPVDGTSVAVHIVDGRVWQVEARGVRVAQAPARRAIPASAAVRSALRATALTDATEVSAPERLIVRRGARHADVWRISVFSLSPAVAAQVDVSVTDGRVIALRSDITRADGTATVFDPNPIVSSKNPDLRQPGVDEFGIDTDLDSPEQTAQLKVLPVLGYDETEILKGKLVGPWVDVQGPAPLDLDGTFDYTKMDPRFETAMAYTHLDRLQRYFQALGFTGEAGVNAEPQNVYALPVVGFDNSFFQPSNDLILFGAGGVDDAEDAEVILHEYGHAIHHAQVSGWGARHEGGAMGEGWGDFLAGTFYAGWISGGFGDLCVADWDATSYSSATPPCLRRLDSVKVYPKDMRNQVHADGEMWSAFLWRLRDMLGCAEEDQSPECLDPAATEQSVKTARSVKLVLASHEFLTSTADFGDAVAALRTAATALGHPEWAPLVDQAASVNKLPLN